MLDLTKIKNLQFDGIDHKDYPDFCDAFITSALYDGEEMTDEQIEELENNYPDFVYEKLMDHIF